MTALPRSLHFHLLRLLISLSTPTKSSSKFLTKSAWKILDDYPNTLHIIFIIIRIDNPSNYLNRHNYIISSIIPITFTLPSYPILSYPIIRNSCCSVSFFTAYFFPRHKLCTDCDEIICIHDFYVI